MSILPSSAPKHRTPGRSFGAIIAAETLTDAQAWIDEVGGGARSHRLALLADMLLAANPELIESEEDVDPDAAADLAVETVIQRLNDEKARAEREAELDAWTPSEAKAVAAASPWRNGPRWVTRSGLTGKSASAGTAVRS
ncbi:hypothetical protein [Kitasatospora cathayae]|uniref:Uncharacterized protein n=1 Tax=Kitasatospora cathayae TaxID=3004092 RepID=A0ABY7QJU4_9ACTN|nr:hypothetical protein [Kitasatospora sp. HUAS 3-15]WBP92184.1 hypothetical protein O1G21_40970 [Kitasatospora sp. HUAS 3-15]